MCGWELFPGVGGVDGQGKLMFKGGGGRCVEGREVGGGDVVVHVSA